MLFQVPQDSPSLNRELVQVVSPAGQLVYVNQAWQEALGYRASELNGLSFFSILDTESRDRFALLFDRSTPAESEHSLELTLTSKDGMPLTVQGTVTLIARAGAVVGAHGTFHDITSHRREEEAQRWSEPSFRTLVEHARDIISTFDMSGTVLSLNPAFGVLTGWDRHDWIGKSFLPLLHPDDQEFAREWFSRSVKGIKVPLHESRVITKTGQYVTFESTFKGLYENGKMYAILGVHRDISDRKAVESMLRESEARFHLLAETCFDAIVIHEDGIVIEANAECANLLQYTKDEMMGKPISKFTDLKSAIRKDGTRFDVQARVRTLPHEGRTVRVAAIRPQSA